MKDKNNIIRDTNKKVKQLLNYDDMPSAIEKLQNDVMNYDKLLIEEVKKRADSLIHRGIEPDYIKIIEKVHKKYKVKLDLYLKVFLIVMQGKAELDMMEGIHNEKE